VRSQRTGTVTSARRRHRAANTVSKVPDPTKTCRGANIRDRASAVRWNVRDGCSPKSERRVDFRVMRMNLGRHTFRDDAGTAVSRGAFLATILLLSGGFSGTAHAAQAARLVYSRAAEARACADETTLRQAVAQRLGYDPFVAASLRTVVAEVRGDGTRLRARVYVVESENVAGGARELSSPSLDCKELISAVALAISIAIDPDAIDRVPDEPREVTPDDGSQRSGPPGASAEWESRPPEDVSPPPIPAPKEPPPAPMRPPAADSSPPRRLVWALGAGGFLASGPAPAPAPGLGLLGAVRAEHWAVSVEPRWELPSSSSPRSNGAGTAEVTSYGVGLVPCYRYAGLLGCYAVEAALVASKGQGVAHPHEDRSFWFAQGPRLAYRLDAGHGLGIAARLDGLWALQRITLRIDEGDVYETPRLLVRFGLDATYEF
jgi:hypothetical protein